MKVELWAHTVVTPQVAGRLAKLDETVTDLDHLGEASGRACYESWDRPNEKTAGNASYMANILRQQHESVLEHASVTFYVAGVSRALSHELVRHRHLSFSQRSQRYVDEESSTCVIPPALKNAGTADDLDVLDEAYDHAKWAYRQIVQRLQDRGLPRKKAREAARAVLPNANTTAFVVTGNLRAWRDVLRKRHHVAADAEIQLFALEVLRHLRVAAPASVQDIPNEPYGDS